MSIQAGGHNYQVLNMYCVGGDCFKESIINAGFFSLSHFSYHWQQIISFHGGKFLFYNMFWLDQYEEVKGFPFLWPRDGVPSALLDHECLFPNSITNSVILLWAKVSFLGLDNAFRFYFIHLWNMDCVLDLQCFIACDVNSNIMYFT